MRDAARAAPGRRPAAVEGRRRLGLAEVGPWTTPVSIRGGIRATDAEDPSQGTRMRRMLQTVADASGRPLRGSGSSTSRASRACSRSSSRAAVGTRRHRGAPRQRRAGAVREGGARPREPGVCPGRRARPLAREYGILRGGALPGILYHLPAPDVFEFAERVAEVTERVAIFDTHVSLPEAKATTARAPSRVRSLRGVVYEGRDTRSSSTRPPPKRIG